MPGSSRGFAEVGTAAQHGRPSFCAIVSESVEGSYCAPWLQIPSLFVEHYLQEYIPKAEIMKSTDKEVMLEGPSGKVWPVSICGMKVTSMGFKTGWRKFATDHQLAQGDVLVIKLMSKFHFKVKTFGKSGLEKNFLLEQENDGKRKRTNVNEVDHLGCPEKGLKRQNADFDLCKKEEMGEVKEEWDSKSIDSCGKGVAPANLDSIPTVIDEFMILDEEPRDAARNLFPSSLTYLVNAKDSHIQKLYILQKDDKPTDPSTIVSQRRPVSEAEKEAALNAARQFRTNLPAFRKIMKKSNVYRGFWLGISRGFAAEYLPCETQQVVLTNSSGKQWITKLLGSRSNPGLSGGWRKFAVDNLLEEGDVCVFELMDRTHLRLTVHIYRVVELGEIHKQDKAHLPKSECHWMGTWKMRGAVSGYEKKSNIKEKTKSLPAASHDHQRPPENKPTKTGELCRIEMEICQQLKSMLMQKKVKEEETTQHYLEPCIVKAEPLDLVEMGIATNMTAEVHNHHAKKLADEMEKPECKAQLQTAASNVKMRGRIAKKPPHECLDNTQAPLIAKKLPQDNDGCIQTQSNGTLTREQKAYNYYDVERLINRLKGKYEDEFLVQLSVKAESEAQRSMCRREDGSWWVPMSYFKSGFDSCHL